MTGEVPSDRCRLDDLFIVVEVGETPPAKLRRAHGWAHSWSVEFRAGEGKCEIPMADLGAIVAGEISPVRAFTWSPR